MASPSEIDRDCRDRYCLLLGEALGERLVAIWIFGSAARGDMWPEHSPMNSDIDLLVVTREDVDEIEQERLVNATYPLYLECGRQLSPHFFSEGRVAAPESAQTSAFLKRIGSEALSIWPRS
jgi:polymorphic toxin system nucleotidyltransferase-like protein